MNECNTVKTNTKQQKAFPRDSLIHIFISVLMLDIKGSTFSASLFLVGAISLWENLPPVPHNELLYLPITVTLLSGHGWANGLGLVIHNTLCLLLWGKIRLGLLDSFSVFWDFHTELRHLPTPLLHSTSVLSQYPQSTFVWFSWLVMGTAQSYTCTLENGE